MTDQSTYYFGLKWNGGYEKGWSKSIRNIMTSYNAVMKLHPNAIGTIVYLRVRPKIETKRQFDGSVRSQEI